MWYDSIDSLGREGFEGFRSIKELRSSRKSVPQEPGIYLVLYLQKTHPEFLQVGTGGWYRKDPNESVEILEKNWIEGTTVIYVGQAGSKTDGGWSNTTLRKRLSLYMRYGQGKAVAHEGGRNIWQIRGCENLIVCWKQLRRRFERPKDVERRMIREFKDYYGDYPFANWQE